MHVLKVMYMKEPFYVHVLKVMYMKGSFCVHVVLVVYKKTGDQNTVEHINGMNMIIKPIIEGRLVKRYKRFLVDVFLNDSQQIMTAHCPNSGAMLGVLQENNPVLLSFKSNPKRRYPYTLHAIQKDQTWVGVDTSLPNELVALALDKQEIPELKGYTTVKREVKYGLNSRIDFLLTAVDKPPCYVEVKNVHLKRHQMAEFPDCVTARGVKHLGELTTLAKQGQRCVMVYVIQRDDCQGFQLAADLDPSYAKASAVAKAAGVESVVLTYSLKVENGPQKSLKFLAQPTNLT